MVVELAVVGVAVVVGPGIAARCQCNYGRELSDIRMIGSHKILV